MAPTEVLARQHIDTIAPLAEAPARACPAYRARKGYGTRPVIFGSQAARSISLSARHALFQPDVVFTDLAFAVIDEQHRFGVHQRMALQAKGERRHHVLVMTATPIPRTLLMTHYGDLDVSRLTGEPAGRKPVVTKAAPIDLLERLIDRIRAQLDEGAQVYWVCPLIESSEITDLAGQPKSRRRRAGRARSCPPHRVRARRARARAELPHRRRRRDTCTAQKRHRLICEAPSEKAQQVDRAASAQCRSLQGQPATPRVRRARSRANVAATAANRRRFSSPSPLLSPDSCSSRASAPSDSSASTIAAYGALGVFAHGRDDRAQPVCAATATSPATSRLLPTPASPRVPR